MLISPLLLRQLPTEDEQSKPRFQASTHFSNCNNVILIKMSDSEQNELKAGHPPAMKVGGKRVPLPKHYADDKAEAPKTEESEDKDKPTPSKTVVISGAQVKEKDVYSAEATRAIHEKPIPTHSNYDGGHQVGPHGTKQAFIQQPRKQ